MTLKMGICLLCRNIRPLTEHHVSHPTTGDKNSIMICKPCHKAVDVGLKEGKQLLTKKESPCPDSDCLKYIDGCIDCPPGVYPPPEEPVPERMAERARGIDVKLLRKLTHCGKTTISECKHLENAIVIIEEMRGPPPEEPEKEGEDREDDCRECGRGIDLYHHRSGWSRTVIYGTYDQERCAYEMGLDFWICPQCRAPDTSTNANIKKKCPNCGGSMEGGLMGDIEESKQLLEEAREIIKSTLSFQEYDFHYEVKKIAIQNLTDTLSLLENMEEGKDCNTCTIEQWLSREPSEEPFEELMKCPECGKSMKPLSGGGRCKATNEWFCAEGHGVWWECAKCGSVDPRHINPIDKSRGPGGPLDKAWWRVAAEEERRKRAEERKEKPEKKVE